MIFKNTSMMIRKLYTSYVENEISALSAQATYYLILSFFPFLIFLFTLISYIDIQQNQSLFVISKAFPSDVYSLVIDVIDYGVSTRKSTFLSVSMLATVWSASSGVYAFMIGINKIYGRKETRPFWMVRSLSVLFTLALVMIILFSLILVVFGELLGRHVLAIFAFARQFNRLWHILRFTVSVATLFIVFILFYKYIPNCKLPAKKVLPGVILSTLGWVILSGGFAYYVNRFDSFSMVYGSIGAVIALLIWLYWSSMVIFVGAELNAILYNPNIKKL